MPERQSHFKTFLTKLRKRRIIETLAAFIAGGWLIIEFVHFIIIGHYHFPDKTLDITFITLICVLLCTLIWRWFSGREEPRKFKLELVLIPLVILIAVLLDINLLLHLKGPEPEAISASKWKNSIAVLPFDNISPEQGQDYFCDGLTDEIISRLSKIKDLKVIAKTSAFSFRGKDIDIRDIGKKLSVAAVLEGGVRKAGNKLRITAQLINVADASHLWSDTYERELTDIFAIQDEIALMIADKLKLALLGEEKSKLIKRPAENLETYDLYLQGRFLQDKGGPYLAKAIDYFSQAIKLNPNYGLAYAGLADVYTTLGISGKRLDDVIPRATEAASKALKIDNKLAEAHLALARLKFYYDWDWSGAEAEFLQAIQLDPNYARAYTEYSINLYVLKRFDEALEKAKRGEELDPLSPQGIHGVGDVLKHMHRYDEAIKLCNKALEMDPNLDDIHWNLWLLSLYKGMYKEALKEMEKLMELGEIGGFPGWRAGPEEMEDFKIVSKERGWKGGLEWNLARTMRKAKKEHVSPFLIAISNVILGHKAAAIQWLEKAYEERDMLMPWLNTDPSFDPIRNDSRFAEILKKMGFEK